MTNDKFQMTNSKNNTYSESSIRDYLNELASKAPVPGGGSAAALVGATGAALLSKVANFTIGKEKYKSVEKEIENILERSEALREEFIKLCSEDAKAYRKLSGAFKLPKTEDRKSKIEDALKEALAVPLEVCKKANETIKLCMPVAQKGNINLITDVGDAALMLDCAFKSALLNVEINLKSIKDKQFILEIKKTLEPIEKQTGSIACEIVKFVKGGMA